MGRVGAGLECREESGKTVCELSDRELWIVAERGFQLQYLLIITRVLECL